jgi:hypothetical protein
VLVVATAGLALRAPLARVPENKMKFVVGVMPTAFGTFWVLRAGRGRAGAPMRHCWCSHPASPCSCWAWWRCCGGVPVPAAQAAVAEVP